VGNIVTQPKITCAAEIHNRITKGILDRIYTTFEIERSSLEEVRNIRKKSEL
jgi:hypothetical protein